MEQLQILQMDSKLDQVLELVSILVPSTFTLSYIANTSGVKYDTIYKYLTRNYIPELDFYKKDDKIVIRRDVGIEILRKYNAKSKTNI